ncbi:MAG: primase C-terminal domain-containing protein [Nitrospirota bacterium]
MEIGKVMIMHEDYCFVDFAAVYQRGFRNNIIHVSEIPKMIRQYKAFECYSTYLLFRKDLQDYTKEHGSVSGYDGAAFAYFLPIDVDDPELEKALETARRIIRLLVEDWGLANEAIQCYFSGSKGFHIMLDSRTFGEIMPSGNLHYKFSKVRETIAVQAKVQIDLAIKDKLRLIRLPNTLHQKSGLYKIQLTLHEMKSLPIEKITEMAKSPGKLTNVDRSGLIPAIDVKPNVMASEVFRKAVSIAGERKVKISIDQGTSDKLPWEVLCDARKEIWLSHIGEGLRHNCAMRVLSQFRNSGFSREKSLRLMTEWNINNQIGLPEREVISMVESVYSSTHPYHYGCMDSILKEYCPYGKRLRDCKFFRRFMAIRGKMAARKS